MKYYLFITWGDVESEIIGPFDSDEARDKRALELRIEDGPEPRNGIFMLDIDDNGKPETYDYSGGFFEDNICWECECIRKKTITDTAPDGTALEEMYECPKCKE